MQFLTTTTESYISLFFTLALMLVLLYFMIYRPQKKQDDTFVLETGSDRVKIRFTKNAISSVEKLNMDNAPANAKK